MNAHNDDKRVDEVLKESLDMETPPEIEARLRKRLDAFRNRMDRADATEKAPFYRVVFERISLPRYGRAFAVAAAVATIALITIAPWNNGPGFAFADVVEHIKALTTLSYDVKVDIEGAPSTESRAMWRAPSRFRMEQSDGITIIMDPSAGKNLSLIEPTKQAIVVSMKKIQTGSTNQSIVDFLNALLDGTEERLGMKEVDGIMAVGFHVSKGIIEAWIWADPETQLPIRVETKHKNVGEGMSVARNFDFNPPLDDDLFSLTPPEGYTVEEMDMSHIDVTLAPGEEHVIEALRVCVDAGATSFPAEFTLMALVKTLTAPQTALVEKMTAIQAGPGTRQEKAVKMKELAELAKKLAEKAGNTQEVVAERTVVFTRASIFAAQMQPENDWNYRGEDAIVGDTESALCWWRPEGSSTYRMVMGDLSVRDVAVSELPGAGGE